jgi:hypothetical protein
VLTRKEPSTCFNVQYVVSPEMSRYCKFCRFLKHAGKEIFGKPIILKTFRDTSSEIGSAGNVQSSTEVEELLISNSFKCTKDLKIPL